MRNIYLFLMSLLISICFISNSYAVNFTFYGIDNGGVGSANMDISISGNALLLTLDNTSPTRLINNSGPNIPCITSFGFNFINNNPIQQPLILWLSAFEIDGQDLLPVIIGGNPIPGSDFWKLDYDAHFPGGVKLDYLPNTITGNHGGLYNPLLVGENLGSGTFPFFTTAYMSMIFEDPFQLDENSVYLKMQRIGENASGSIELHGNPIVPEPATMVLLGSLASGLFGFAGLRKRFTK